MGNVKHNPNFIPKTPIFMCILLRTKGVLKIKQEFFSNFVPSTAQNMKTPELNGSIEKKPGEMKMMSG